MILYYHSAESNAFSAFSRCTNYRELMSLIPVDIVLYYKKFTLKFSNLPLAVLVNFLYFTISSFFSPGVFPRFSGVFYVERVLFIFHYLRP